MGWMPPPRALVVVTSLATLLAAGCGADGRAGASAADGPEADALLALCRVAASLADGEVDVAEATFEDGAHETLHEVAHELEEVDRAAAATLLEAKAKVEAGFASADPDPAALRADVQGLVAAFAHSLAALDVAAPSCPEET